MIKIAKAKGQHWSHQIFFCINGKKCLMGIAGFKLNVDTIIIHCYFQIISIILFQIFKNNKGDKMQTRVIMTRT